VSGTEHEVAGDEAVLLVAESVAAGQLMIWFDHPEDKSLSLVTNGRRAMVTVWGRRGYDEGVNAVDPDAGDGEQGGYVLDNGQDDSYPDASTVELEKAIEAVRYVIDQGVPDPRLHWHCWLMLATTRGMTNRDLLAYGEDETARWVEHCADDELLRICGVANWLLYGPTTRSDSSMNLARACALAAVFIREGRPRQLARAVRKSMPQLTPAQTEASRSGSPNYQQQQELDQYYGVTAEFQEFWTPGV
jgi:hypothetical protein